MRAERRGCPVRRELFNSASGAEELSGREAFGEARKSRQLDRSSRHSEVRPVSGASKNTEAETTR